MKNLLNLAVEAHGGLRRWRHLRTMRANVSITGALWHQKRKADVLKNAYIEAHLHDERVLTHLIDRKKRMVFSPSQVAIETEDGHKLESRDNPRSVFEHHRAETPWDDLHVAYFSSYALWTYFTIPFLYTYPGFVTEELSPWHEDWEEWRQLKVTFPDYIASHNREQVSYFSENGLLRRHEYAVDILGGARGLNYAADYQNVSGIIVPTKRKVYPTDAIKQKVAEPILVAIDLSHIEFEAD